MPNFTAGTSFTDGVTNDVTAAKLNALIADAVPTSNLSLNSTTGTISAFSSGTGTAGTVAIGPAGDANNGFFFPAADTIAASTSGTERLRIDSSGRVGIGVTPSNYKLEISGTGANSGFTAGISLNGGQSGSDYDSIGYNFRPTATSNVYNYNTNDASSRIEFNSGGFLFKNAPAGTAGNQITYTERLRIDSSGNLLVGATVGQSSERLLVQNSSASNPSFIAYSPSSTFAGTVARFWADRNTSNSTYNFVSCTRVGSAGDVFIIRDSGNVVNTNNSYGAISDIKLKENIDSALSQWDDIKALRVRKFSFKNDESHSRLIGLIAQEVEQVSPHLIEESLDYEQIDITGDDGVTRKESRPTGTTTKGVKYSVLYMKAIKALQEAMERIENLEAKVAALEAA